MVAEITEDQHRALAVEYHNRAWELIEEQQVSGIASGRDALTYAFASRLHWKGVGTTENLAIAEWMVAHVASRLGHADLALEFAAAAHETVTTAAEPLPAWLVASTLEGLARAHAVAGNAAERDRYAEECRRVLETEPDEEDREHIAAQLASI